MGGLFHKGQKGSETERIDIEREEAEALMRTERWQAAESGTTAGMSDTAAALCCLPTLELREIDVARLTEVTTEDIIDRFLRTDNLRIVAEEGASVKRGDVIIEMSNNSLSMQILQSEADLAEKQNILRNTLISMEQERLSLRQNRLQLDLDVERKRRAYLQNEELYKSDLLAKEDWLR